MPGSSSRSRCPWVNPDKPDYVAYHDTEWGVPLHDDRALFELLTLEGAQAGLSWYTVLVKRARYREVFFDFDIKRVAAMSDDQALRLLEDPGVIRHRQKLLSTPANARGVLAVQQEQGSFADYLWSYVGDSPQVNAPRSAADFRATSPESDALSRDLKRRGFKFVGSTIVYAFMQAAGLVNDHVVDCFRYAELQQR